jgi:hypothetical protein
MSKARNIARLLLSNSGVVPVSSIQSVNASSITSQLSHRSLPAGQSLQVQSTFYNWYNSMSLTGSWQNVPNMSVNITPKFVNSRIKIDVRWFGEVSSAWDVTFGIARNGTPINLPTQEASRYGCLGMPNQSYVNDDNDSTPEFSFFSTIDAPNTISVITYTMVARSYGDTRTMWNGRVFSGTTNGNYEQGSSEITVTEYAT